MKKIFTLAIILVGLAPGLKVNAQAFNENSRQITAFIGGADLFHIPVGYTFNSFIYPTTAEAGVEGEFAVHKYVGVGFDAELGGRGSRNRSYFIGAVPYAYTTFYSEFNMAFGGMANFHFYQLIADQMGKSEQLMSDKIDVYAGLNVGTGFALHPGYTDVNGHTKIASDALFYIGPQFGMHYFFTPKIAINGEFGWGKTWGRIGVTFNLGK